MSYDDNNIFAKILRGEIPCNKIYEDDFVLSFFKGIFIGLLIYHFFIN